MGCSPERAINDPNEVSRVRKDFNEWLCKTNKEASAACHPFSLPCKGFALQFQRKWVVIAKNLAVCVSRTLSNPLYYAVISHHSREFNNTYARTGVDLESQWLCPSSFPLFLNQIFLFFVLFLQLQQNLRKAWFSSNGVLLDGHGVWWSKCSS